MLKYTVDEFKNYRNLDPNNTEILDKYRKSIQNYISFCKTNDIRLILMSQFNRIDNKSEVFVEDYNKFNQSKSVDEFIYLYKEANSIVSEISSLNNVEFIDLNNLVPKTSEYIYDMIHLTDKGSLLVSEIITNYLKKLHYERTFSISFIKQEILVNTCYIYFSFIRFYYHFC